MPMITLLRVRLVAAVVFGIGTALVVVDGVGSSADQAPRPQQPDKTVKAATEKCRRYVSRHFLYSVCIPNAWQLLDPSPDPADIVNFPPARREHAVVIPSGGASITIVGPIDETIDSVDKWLAYNKRFGLGDSRRTIKLRGSSVRQVEVVETMGTADKVAPIMRSVNDYFTAGGRPFMGALLFWDDDPDSKRYIQILHEMILTLEAQ
jgi:hypothetical protein